MPSFGRRKRTLLAFAAIAVVVIAMSAILPVPPRVAPATALPLSYRNDGANSIDRGITALRSAASSLRRGEGPSGGEPLDCTLSLEGSASCSPTDLSNTDPSGSPGAWQGIDSNQCCGAIANDSATGEVLEFGGVGVAGISNSTWEFDNGSWGILFPSSSPPPLQDASLVYDPSVGGYLLFGGSGLEGYSGATWEFKSGTWHQLTLSSSPSARSQAGMVYDAKDGYLLLFGGIGSSGALGDTWKFVSGAWTELSPGTSPPARSGLAMAYDSALGEVVMFGGLGNSGEVNDTWVFTAGDWSKVTTSVAPTPRVGAELADDPTDGYAVLFGGSSDGQPLGDTWAFQISGWAELFPATPPSYRSGDEMTFYNGGSYVLLVGGLNQSNYLSDSWEYTNGEWNELASGQPPSVRQGAAMTYDAADGYVLLFGGASCPCSDFYQPGPGDTWEFRDGNWTELFPSSSPGPRIDASMAYDAALGTVILFGGVTDDWNSFFCSYYGVDCYWYNLDDTWQFSAGQWTQLAPSAAPSPREGAGLVYDSALGALVLYGGCSGAPASCGTWYSDTWEYTDGDWSNITGHSSPPARAYPGLTYDATTGTVLMFGGNASSGPLADTWELNGTAWKVVAEPSSPTARWGPDLVYDPVGGDVLLFGGAGRTLLLNDTWSWQAGLWTNLSSQLVQSPPPRFDGPAIFDPDVGYAMIFGGQGASGELNDTWAWVLTPSLHVGATPTLADVNQTIQFTALEIGLTGPIEFQWAFGDGTNSTLESPTHAYAQAGTYTASAWANNSTLSLEGSVAVTVNGPLSVSASCSSANIDLGVQVDFTATPKGGTAPYQFEWSFGDHTSGSGATPVHIYQTPGNYTVQVNVTDTVDEIATAYVAVTVWPALSVSVSAGESSTDVGIPIGFTSTIAGGYEPYNYTWKFGDGATGWGSSTSHSFNRSGAFTVTLSVVDHGGGVASASTTVRISALPAIVSFTASPSPVRVGNSTELTVTVAGGISPFTFAYSSLPAGCDSANTSTLSCTPSQAGNYSVSVRVTDSLGLSATKNLSLEVTSVPTTTHGGPGSSSMGTSSSLFWIILGVVVAIVVVGTAVAVVRRRRGKIPPETTSSTQPKQ